MGPIEASFRETAILARQRLSAFKSRDKVEILEEEIRQLKRQIMLMNMQLGHAKDRSREAMAIAEVERVIELVCAKEQISRVDIVSKRRTSRVVMPRHICFYLAATHTIASLPIIGAAFNKADHTTVLYGRRKIEKLRLKDASLDERVAEYEEILSIPAE